MHAPLPSKVEAVQAIDDIVGDRIKQKRILVDGYLTNLKTVDAQFISNLVNGYRLSLVKWEDEFECSICEGLHEIKNLSQQDLIYEGPPVCRFCAEDHN